MYVISADIRKAKKTHQCDYCGFTIEVGEQYKRYYIENGDTYYWKTHLLCEELTTELDMWDDVDPGEGLSREAFWEEVHEAYLEIKGDQDVSSKEELDVVKEYYLGQ